MTRWTPCVYLAWPIGGCSPGPVFRRRVRVEQRWSDEYDLIDPAEYVVVDGEETQSHQVVRKDTDAIQHVDAVPANPSKESIRGTWNGRVCRRARRPSGRRPREPREHPGRFPHLS